MSTKCFAICRVTELAVLVGTSKAPPLFEAWPADLCNGGGSAEEEGTIKSAARGGRYCCGIGKGCRCQHTVRHSWNRLRPCNMNDACSCWAMLLLQRRLERFHLVYLFSYLVITRRASLPLLRESEDAASAEPNEPEVRFRSYVPRDQELGTKRLPAAAIPKLQEPQPSQPVVLDSRKDEVNCSAFMLAHGIVCYCTLDLPTPKVIFYPRFFGLACFITALTACHIVNVIRSHILNPGLHLYLC